MLLNIILIIVVSIFSVCFAILKLLKVAHIKHLFDEPIEDRKIHILRTPNLGGVAIIASFIFTVSIFTGDKTLDNINYFIASTIVLFSIGLTDDLIGVHFFKKFVAQLLVAFITVCLADFRIESLFGFLGIFELPYPISISISLLFIVFLMNAINLIDGINTLAGGIGLLCCVLFSFLFSLFNDTSFVFYSICMGGCLTGFLAFNYSPAKIFMGDTGSLFLGYILSVFSIRFLHLSFTGQQSAILNISGILIVFGLLIIPLLDTARVFILRILNKKSPFVADRNHLHHLLLDAKLSHIQASAILLVINLTVCICILLLRQVRAEFVMILVLAGLNSCIFFFKRIQKVLLARKGSSENLISGQRNSGARGKRTIIVKNGIIKV